MHEKVKSKVRREMSEVWRYNTLLNWVTCASWTLLLWLQGQIVVVQLFLAAVVVL